MATVKILKDGWQRLCLNNTLRRKYKKSVMFLNLFDSAQNYTKENGNQVLEEYSLYDLIMAGRFILLIKSIEQELEKSLEDTIIGK